MSRFEPVASIGYKTMCSSVDCSLADCLTTINSSDEFTCNCTSVSPPFETPRIHGHNNPIVLSAKRAPPNKQKSRSHRALTNNKQFEFKHHLRPRGDSKRELIDTHAALCFRISRMNKHMEKRFLAFATIFLLEKGSVAVQLSNSSPSKSDSFLSRKRSWLRSAGTFEAQGGQLWLRFDCCLTAGSQIQPIIESIHKAFNQYDR